MPRKAFLRDLEISAQPGRVPQISSVRAGADDGAVNFAFISHSLPIGEIFVEALVPEVSEYPDSHSYYLYTTSPSEYVPPAVSESLELLQVSLRGHNLSQMLTNVSANLQRAISPGLLHDPIELDDNSDEDAEHDEPSEDEEDGDEDLWSPKSPFLDSSDRIHGSSPATSRTAGVRTARGRIRSDLQVTKRAGFKVGILGDLDSGSYVCVSIRVVKLGLSEEAMQAWGLQRKQYLLLMVRFDKGYKTLEQVSEEAATAGNGKTEMRVALSERYKPSITDAVNAFTRVPHGKEPHGEIQSSHGHGQLESLFIGRPLNELLRERFSSIVKYRLIHAFSWTGAETFFNDIQGKHTGLIDTSLRKYSEKDHENSRILPSILMADHIQEISPGQKLSLPLTAMQFVLRHFARCTEFCLVCHCRIEASFEALKPYVCSKPLCLYQYMNLGFGPSVEWEILAQPYVVDLLVSFCYTSARQGKLRDFPIGIDLRVPLLPLPKGSQVSATGGLVAYNEPESVSGEPQRSFTAKFDATNMTLLFRDSTLSKPVRVGDWIAIVPQRLDNYIHTRIEETCMWPIVKLTSPGILAPTNGPGRWNSGAKSSSNTTTSANTPSLSQTSTSTGPADATCFIYNQSFDKLNCLQKQHCITVLLDTLPCIIDIKDYLESRKYGQDPSLKNWLGRISESVLNLLRWIIASNRSCIMQVDRCATPGPSGSSQPSVKAQDHTALRSPEDRVSGMGDWMQFRFAQGAPDKEQRFIDCVNEVSKRTGRKYPTLFAWHGSALANWHSIVRQGLNFEQTVNGRAYGNGVYMSSQFNISMGYSQMYLGDTSGLFVWPNSRLKILCALALNEVVNDPDNFVSKSPHYVVQNLDWIQTRYLFVKADYQHKLGLHLEENSRPSRVYEQDPAFVAQGQDLKAIVIPITAVSKSRRPVLKATSQLQGRFKKAKRLVTTDEQTAEQEEDDAASIVTDQGDLDFLLSSDEEPVLLSQISSKIPSSTQTTRNEQPKTDFIPGTLDVLSLKMLKEPKDASTTTTKTLLQALRSTLSVQDSTPTHELGWYINRELITNIYQWIVEMHSFDTKLPLAQDMKSAGLTSIVIEMRFTNQYPFSPPFVRVVRPRFLPFQLGGGGHVTAGGAICMELLTNTGWLLGSSIESVLLQVRMAMSSTERPARLEATGKSGGRSPAGGVYGVAEAIQAYKRACVAHGWTPAKDIDTLSHE